MNKINTYPSEVKQLAPEKLPKPNRKVVFQPPFFRGELLNFRGEVNFPAVTKPEILPIPRVLYLHFPL